MALRHFLSETKKALLVQKTVKFVIGNEACDLDSCVSAVVYAHTLQSLLKDQNFFCIPILNILRKNYDLKTEVNYWFNHFGIGSELLTFRDEIDVMKYCNEEHAEIVLVDHNVPGPSDQDMEPFISSIIDHHALERSNTPVHGMIVEPVGSCCTLIVEQMKENASHLITEDIAKLLYGTIILDTVNLNEEAKRTTKKDEDVIHYLEGILNISITERNSIFDQLTASWSDISKLTLEQILCKDQKKISKGNFTIVVSAVPMLIQELATIRDLNEIPSFVTHNEYDLLILMGMKVAETVQRDLLVYATKKSVLFQVSKYLENTEASFLKLKYLECDLINANSYSQKNIAASRKKVLPILKQWLQSF